MMIKLVLVAALLAVVSSAPQGGAGGAGFGFGHGGYGHGGYHLGYGFVAGGGHGGYGHGHHGGVAKVNVHQNPHSYQYNLNEHGPGYTKYINQGASTAHGGYAGGYGGGY